MKNRDLAEPGLPERSQERSVPQSEPANVAAISTTGVAEISNETGSNEAKTREMAFWLYEERGYRDGHDVEDWLEAEAVIRSQAKHAV